MRAEPADFGTKFEELKKIFEAMGSVVIFGHINPDGDSVGAVLSIRRILIKIFGKKEEDVRIVMRDAVPDFLKFLPGSEAIKKYTESPAADAELAVLMDCGDAKRIGEELAGHLKAARSIAVMDHHATNSGFGDVNLTDPDASSTCELVCRFMDWMGIQPDRDMSTCLYTGIMYDTGRFIHSNTTPEVFAHCARLVELGADPSAIAMEVYGRRSEAHLRLLGYVLSNFKTEENGAIAYIGISRAVFDSLGAGDEDNEGVVEEMGRYSGCEVHATFMELPEGKVRVSMRSKGRVVVGSICGKFGGGGHDFAAGVRMKDSLESAIEKVISETRARLRDIEGRN